MGTFRGRGTGRVEARLRAGRAEAPEELVRHIAGLTEARRPRRARLRLGFAAGLTVAMSAAIASVGGVSYAADAASGAADVIKRAIAPSKSDGSISVSGINSGGDQYRPGYGFGDPNHNHTGPPALERSAGGGTFAAPARARRTPDGLAAVVATEVTVSEQAHLTISVVGPDGKKVLLTQKSSRGGSKVGNGVEGPQTKNIQYALLVPRTIAIQLRIPINLLVPGRTYRISIQAKDPDGNVSTTTIPFRL